MIRIAICDDEQRYRDSLRKFCEKFFRDEQKEIELKEFTFGDQSIADAEADILLLDIEMSGLDGIQVKELLQEQRNEVRIIFVTIHEENMPEAFGRQVFGFLKKPVTYKNFCKIMWKVLRDIIEQDRFVICEIISGVQKVYLREIQYIESQGRYTKLHLAKEAEYVFTNKKIGSWSEELSDEGFRLCHRRFLVNYEYVSKIGKCVVLRDGKSLPLSRDRKEDFKNGYREFVRRRSR